MYKNEPIGMCTHKFPIAVQSSDVVSCYKGEVPTRPLGEQMKKKKIEM